MYGRVLYDSALMTSGFPVEDGVSFATRLNKLISNGLGIDPDAPLAPEYELPEEEEEEEEEAEEARRSSSRMTKRRRKSCSGGVQQ